MDKQATQAAKETIRDAAWTMVIESGPAKATLEYLGLFRWTPQRPRAAHTPVQYYEAR